jgi:Rps23 Pro-64 3,4-dihydroxylase Tpa1-like proline 4-hydroxylase
LASTSKAFAVAQPYPHIVLDDFLETEACEALLNEFEYSQVQRAWVQYVHYNQVKQGLKDQARMGPKTQEILNTFSSPRFIAWLEKLAGVNGLLWDSELDGGGLHKTERGGFLNVHTDFLAHTTRPTWSRQINLIVYLNKDWKEEYGGALELWDGAMSEKKASVMPKFNRCLIFRTGSPSNHGHPNPLNCPPDMARRSLALYYYRDEGRVLQLEPTNYRATPNDRWSKRLLIKLDKKLLNTYSYLKRKGSIDDRLVSRILSLFK